jgi:hypothetical protein
MAIKGKTKARSRRSVTPGPKPVYVVPKKRFLARRSVQFALLGLLVVGAIGGITYGLIHEHHQQQAQDLQQRLSDTIGSYKDQITAALTSDVGQPNQTTGFDVTPAALALIEPLKSGKNVPRTRRIPRAPPRSPRSRPPPRSTRSTPRISWAGRGSTRRPSRRCRTRRAGW